MKVVLCTVPVEAAESLASSLIEQRSAACVNLLRDVTSVYRWKGDIERSQETLLIIKTSDDSVARLTAQIEDLHPYEVPEIVALDVVQVNDAYGTWVDGETSF